MADEDGKLESCCALTTGQSVVKRLGEEIPTREAGSAEEAVPLIQKNDRIMLTSSHGVDRLD